MGILNNLAEDRLCILEDNESQNLKFQYFVEQTKHTSLSKFKHKKNKEFATRYKKLINIF